jgi:DnaJ-class molecular chaperone
MNPDHATKLRAGLAALGSGFLASICGICKGEGQHGQTYTVGCGGGYFRMRGDCEYCDGQGLTQYYRPAPRSVVNQVLVAAEC